jgi:hypothetical protein
VTCQRIEALQAAAAAKETLSAADTTKGTVAEQEEQAVTPAERGASPAEAAEHERHNQDECTCEVDDACAAAVRAQRALEAPASAETAFMRQDAFTALQVRANTGPMYLQLHPGSTVDGRGYSPLASHEYANPSPAARGLAQLTSLRWLFQRHVCNLQRRGVGAGGAG